MQDWRVGIGARDRKLLWGKSGNLCAICRTPLTRQAETHEDGDAIIGEEAHIVGQGKTGPRSGLLSESAVDAYENLILLCANDHTMIDKHINDYSVDRLLVIKDNHEHWVRRRLTNLQTESAMGWSPKEPGAPIVLPRITSGRQAFETIAGTMAYLVDSPPDDAAPLHVCDAADEFLQIFTDWGEVSGAVIDRGQVAKRDAERSLGECLTDLQEHGLVAFGAQRVILLSGGSLPPYRGTEAVVVVRIASEVDGLDSLIAVIESELSN